MSEQVEMNPTLAEATAVAPAKQPEVNYSAQQPEPAQKSAEPKSKSAAKVPPVAKQEIKPVKEVYGTEKVCSTNITKRSEGSQNSSRTWKRRNSQLALWDVNKKPML